MNKSLSLFSLVLFFTSFNGYSQQNIEVHSPISGAQNIEACRSIRFWPESSYTPSIGVSLWAGINPNGNCNPTFGNFTSGDYQSMISTIPDIDRNLPFVSEHGDFDVSSGQFAYRISLFSGEKGSNNVSVVVSGTPSGSSFIGQGAGLSGFSSIVWSQGTNLLEYRTEHVLPPASYDITDDCYNSIHFELDGKDLLRRDESDFSAPCFGNGVNYVTRIDDFTDIQSHGAYTPGTIIPDYFTVQTKDGLYIEYGRTSDSKVTGVNIDGANVVLEWKINLVRDQNGYETRYIYTHKGADGAHVPYLIELTHPAIQSNTPIKSVQFTYDERLDAFPTYTYGNKKMNNLLLDRVYNYVNGEAVFVHIMNYEKGNDNQARLHSIGLMNSEGELSNTYMFRRNSLNRAVSISTRTAYEGQSFYHDMDNDGDLDLITLRFKNTNNYTYELNIYHNQGGGTFSLTQTGDINSDADLSVGLKPIYPRLFFGDFNGDGYDDFGFVRNETVSSEYRYLFKAYYSNNGTFSFGSPSWSANTSRLLNEDYIEPYIGDFNGDGIDDILVSFADYVISNSSIYYGAYRIRGSQNGLIVIDDMTTNPNGGTGTGLFSSSYSTNTGAYSGFEFNESNMILKGDFNADGRDDIMMIGESGAEVVQFDRNFDKITDFIDPHVNIINRFKAIYPGDYNGDGKTDVMTWANGYGWRIHYGDGHSTQYPPEDITTMMSLYPSGSNTSQKLVDLYSTSSSDKVYTGDYDGNGQTDIIIVRHDGTYQTFDIHYSTCLGFESSSYTTSITSTFLNLYSVVDVDNDGKDELIHDPNIFAGSKNTYFSFASGNQYLAEVRDPMGSRVIIHHSLLSSSTSGIYSTSSTPVTYPYNRVNGAIPVVEKIELENGLGGWQEYDYRYEDLLNHAYFGDLGYLREERHNSLAGATTILQRKIEPQTNGVIPEYQIQEVNQSQVKRYEYNFNITESPVAHESYFDVELEKQTEIDFVLDQAKEEYFEYDNYGNNTKLTIRLYSSASFTPGLSSYLEVHDWTYGQYNTWIPSSVLTESIFRQQEFTPGIQVNSSTTYDVNGRVISQTKNAGTSLELVTSYLDYDAFGNPRTIERTDNSEVRSTSSVYSDDGLYLTSETNEIGFVTQKFYNQIGQIVSSIDPNGRETTFEYNSWGVQEKIIYFNGNQETVEFGWSDTQTDPALSVYYQTEIQPSGEAKSVFYDIKGRRIYNLVTGANSQMLESFIEYNSLGQAWRESTLKVVGSPVDWTTFTYDDYGRKAAISTAAESFSISYTNRRVDKVNNYTGEQDYSISNLLGQQIEAGDDGGTITYVYNNLGKVIELNGPSGTTTLDYDINGNRTSIDDPDGGLRTYEFNAFGEETQRVDAKAQTFEIGRDELGRELSESGPDYAIETVYDPSGNLGQISSQSMNYGGDAVTSSQEYDNNGFVKSTTLEISSTQETWTFDYTHDDDGKVESMVYPSGLELQYIYNSVNELTSIYAITANGNFTVWARGEIDENNRIVSFDLGNGISESVTYKDNTNLVESWIVDGVFEYNYNWNAASQNLISRSEGNSGFSENFTYDNLNRLESWQVNGLTQTYYEMQYTPNGNIASKSDYGEYEYNSSRPHAVTNVLSIVEDPIEDQELEYTSFDQVSTIIQENTQAFLQYGPDKQRVRSKIYVNEELSQTRTYVNGYYEEVENHLEETSVSISYIVVAGNPIAAWVEVNGEGNMYYLHTDYQRNLLAVTDQDGNLTESFNYDPWGNKRNPQDWSETSMEGYQASSSMLFRGFNFHENLEMFNIINMNGRLYDPALARFYAPDRFIQMPDGTQGLNRYSYVWNNPLKYTDQDGELVLETAVVLGVLFFTDIGYDIQKWVSPVALHVDLSFGSHTNGIGLDVSVGLPQSIPFSYRYEVGASYYFTRAGGYGRGWQVRNGAVMGFAIGPVALTYGGIRYQDFDENGDLLVDQVVHTMQIGNPIFKASYSNDTKVGSWDWALPLWFREHVPYIPELRDGFDTYDSDRYRTAQAYIRLWGVELGMWLHTGEGEEIAIDGNTRFFDRGNIREERWSNGILYLKYMGLSIGWDAEGIRHFFQNRIAHDGASSNPQFGFQYPWILDTGRNPRFVFQFGTF